MKLTVIVTVYNIEKYLPRFFDSMAAQTFTDYKLLMVDDGSEDGSLEVCKKYAEQDSRIEILSLEHVGIAKARNISMSHIDTEFTAYADGDDYVEPDYLKNLMDALAKHNADLSISRVAYHLEKDNLMEGAFPARGELFIPRDEFANKLPMLLEDRRLNYLYGKVYRSELLKDIRVEDNVRQGSDTMINCQYVAKAKSIVLIDDLDYHYIKYKARSVTSYSGGDAFQRICRINKFVYVQMDKNGFLTDEMKRTIDTRVLLSAIWCIDRICEVVEDRKMKEEGISQILNDEYYKETYERQRENLAEIPFQAISPQSGEKYLKRKEKEEKRNTQKANVLARCPKWVVRLYHKIKGVEE